MGFFRNQYQRVRNVFAGLSLLGERGWDKTPVVGSGATQTGQTITPDVALTVSTYYACIRAIAEDIGKLPFKVYRRLDGAREEAVEHPAYPLLKNAPNRTQGAMTFRESQTAYALGWGSAFAEIQRDGMGRPARLSQIHPCRVRPKIAPDGALSWKVWQPKGVEVDIPDERMFHVHGLGGGIVGYSIASNARECLGLAKATEDFGARFFGAGAHPGGVLEIPHKLSDDAYKRLKESWEQQYSGGGVHKPAILEDGLKWTAIAVPPEDAQFLQTRQFQADEICRWFRVPPHKAGILTRATFSNIEQQAIEYVVDCLTGWCRRWEEEADRKLCDGGGEYYAKFELQALLRGDSAARAAFYVAMRNMGALNANEIRGFEDLNPINGGDKYLVQLNMTTLDKAGAAPTESAAPSPTRPPAAPPPAEDAEDEPERVAAPFKIESLRPAFAEAARRCVNCETNWMAGGKRRADELGKWCAGHRAYIIAAFGPLAQSAIALGARGDAGDRVEAFAARYCTEMVATGQRHDYSLLCGLMMEACNGD